MGSQVEADYRTASLIIRRIIMMALKVCDLITVCGIGARRQPARGYRRPYCRRRS